MEKETNTYDEKKMRDELLSRIQAAAHAYYGETLPTEAQERMQTEIGHIFQNGHAPLLALTVRIAELSKSLGYPIGFRGYFCNLFLAYLLELVPENPLDHHLPWEAFLGLNGEKTPVIYINVADEVLKKAEEKEELALFPKVGLYRCGLFEDIRQWSRFARLEPREIDVSSESLIKAAYNGSAGGIPDFENDHFRELARELQPKTLEELAKIIGMCHGTNVWIPVQKDYYEKSEQKEQLWKELIGSAEDVFDICMRYGIKREAAFRITEKIRRGREDMLTDEETDLLNRKEIPKMFRDTIRQIRYLFSKGQCLNYAHWYLVLLQYKRNESMMFSQ